VRYIIYGAGAVGGVIGGRLHQAGHEVVLIARGDHLEAIRERGLTLRWPGGEATLPIPTAGHPSEVAFRPDDAVILAMKTQDTEAALDALRAAAGDVAVPVICAQNGVENERMALRRFARVYGMLVILPGTHLQPGVVEADSAPTTGILDAGRYPEGADAFIEQVAKNLEGATFRSRSEKRIMRWKYNKLLGNLANALQAICGPGADTGGLASEARKEAQACFKAAGIEVAGRLEMELRRRQGALSVGDSRKGGSTWQSMARGTGTTEVDYLNGEIVLLGRLHGVPTPVNETLQRVATRLATERAAPGCITVEELRREVEGAKRP
jgi:2-dehydropantoate 2-reductase